VRVELPRGEVITSDGAQHPAVDAHGGIAVSLETVFAAARRTLADAPD